MDHQLDARPFFQILHNLLRQDELDYDPEQTAKTVEWVRHNSGVLRKVTTQAEFRVIITFYAYWDKHKIAPDRKMMDELIHSNPQPKTLLEVMEEYDKHVDDLEQVSHLSLDMYLDQRKLDYEKYKLSRTLDIAGLITVGSVPMNDKAKTVFTGPRDAMKYLHEEFHKGIMIDHAPAIGGDLVEQGLDAVALRLDKALLGGANVIPTLTPIDESLRIGPDNTIRYIGILGFTNQRKSTLLFSLAYTAASSGYRVLFVPRECSVEDAWMRFIWLHAHAVGLADELPPLANALDQDALRREHVALVQSLRQSMIDAGIRIDVRHARDWASVAALADQHIDDPYDLLAIDYIAHLDTPGARNHKDGIIDVFRQAQGLSQDYNGGRGLVVMTPVQANKKGEEAVRENTAPLENGIYTDVGAIDYYTDAGRDFDALIGVWSGEGIREHRLARISCVKSRQKFFEPFFMRVDERSQTMEAISDSRAAHIILSLVASPRSPNRSNSHLSVSNH